MSELKQSGISKENFYLQEPKPPFQDPWTLLLMGMSFVIATGFAAYAFMAWMFGEIGQIGEVKLTITTIGAFALALGGEFTTPLTIWEVYRKVGTKSVSLWDWMALAASLIATLVALILGAAGLIQVNEETAETARLADMNFIANILTFLNLWPDIVKGYAPIILVFVASADGYAHFIETGLRIGSYDRRHEEWQARYDHWSEWGAAEVGWAKKLLDEGVKQEYNWGEPLTRWPEEPPVKKDDTPVAQPVSHQDMVDAFRMSKEALNKEVIAVDPGEFTVGYDPGNGKDYGARVLMRKLDSGEVQIEDIEYLHPAVAKSILSND